MRKSKADLEKKLKLLESSLDNDACVFEYNQYKKQLERIFENISEGIRVRSRCQWYEEGEKSTKFFLNQEILHVLQGKVRKIIVNSKEITSNSEIRKDLRNYYKALFKNYNLKSFSDHEEFLDKIDIPKLDIGDKDLCDKDLSESELYMTLLGMENNKSPGNDGLTKEFYVFFRHEIKELLINSSRTALENKELSISQRQASIKVD